MLSTRYWRLVLANAESVSMVALCALSKMPTIHDIDRSDMCYIRTIPLKPMTRTRETTGRWYPTTRGFQVVHLPLSQCPSE
jgi:hypothetical protein